MEKQFGFTSYATEATDEKIDFQFLEEALNKKIDLRNFGTGIEKIYFAFLAVPPQNINHDEEISFKKISKRILIRKKLPYESVLKYSKQNLQKLIAQTFFFSLQHIEFLEIEAFDRKKFLEEIEQLFLKNGWLEKVGI